MHYGSSPCLQGGSWFIHGPPAQIQALAESCSFTSTNPRQSGCRPQHKWTNVLCVGAHSVHSVMFLILILKYISIAIIIDIKIDISLMLKYKCDILLILKYVSLLKDHMQYLKSKIQPVI